MAEFNFGTRVVIDDGARRRLSTELRTLGVKRPLVVTDAGLVRAGIADAVSGLLVGLYETRFDATPENPTEASVEAAAAAYSRRACDGIVGLGGGSPMDLAKALAVRLGDQRSIAHRAFHVCGWNPPPLPKMPPLVLMPTTAGTGSEVSRGAVLTFGDGRKSGLLTQGVVRLALCDPELTHGLPERMTAATGMDAISHCLEAFCSPTINPVADAIALDGLQRLVLNIELATRDGRNASARAQMMLGSLEGGMALQKGIGAIHALSHPLGATGAHHGLINSVLMPHVLSWNASALGEKLPALRFAMRLDANGDVSESLRGIRDRLELPGRLRELNIPGDDLGSFAAKSVEDSSQSNPRPMYAPDYQALLNAAW